MTHTQILLRELSLHGQTTYRDLMRQYEDQGYTYAGFTAAVRRLVQRGLIAPRPMRKRSAIVISGCCPCCGRAIPIGGQ